MSKTKRRFIAGAVCPKCGTMDSIVVVSDIEPGHRECVSCDFKEMANFSKTKEELPTRVNKVNQVDVERSAVQVIKILPTGKNNGE